MAQVALEDLMPSRSLAMRRPQNAKALPGFSRYWIPGYTAIEGGWIRSIAGGLDTRISALTPAGVLANADLFAIDQAASGNTLSVRADDLAAYIKALPIPLGTLAQATATANQGSITTEVALTGLSVTLTPGSGRRLLVSFTVEISSTVSGDVVVVNLKEGATVLQRATLGLTGASVSWTVTSWVTLTPTAVSHTYNLTAQRASGTGTLTLQAASTFPSTLLVEDIGT